MRRSIVRCAKFGCVGGVSGRLALAADLLLGIPLFLSAVSEKLISLAAVTGSGKRCICVHQADVSGHQITFTSLPAASESLTGLIRCLKIGEKWHHE